jgi:hypothetical protein
MMTNGNNSTTENQVVDTASSTWNAATWVLLHVSVNSRLSRVAETSETTARTLAYRHSEGCRLRSRRYSNRNQSEISLNAMNRP